MPIYEQTPIRLQINLVGTPPVYPIDANTGAAPAFWRASAVSLAVGIFDAAGNPVDLANLVASGQLVLQLFKTATDLVPLVTKTIAGNALYPLITAPGWANGTQQNATFLLTPGETDQALGGATSASFWLVLNGTTSAGSQILYAAGPATIFLASNAIPASAMPTPSENAQTSTAGNISVTPGSNLHTEVVTLGGSARSVSLILGQAGLTKGAIVQVLLLSTGGTVAAINVAFRVGSIGGANPFNYTTPGGVTQALFKLYFDGANLQALEKINPAF